MDAVTRTIAAIKGVVKGGAVAVLNRAGKDAVAQVQERLNVYGAGAPSPPGSPPHRQTGGLRESVSYLPATSGNLVVTIVVDHPAAFYLEFGTRTMAPRPFLRGSTIFFAHQRLPQHFRLLVGARHDPDLIAVY